MSSNETVPVTCKASASHPADVTMGGIVGSADGWILLEDGELKGMNIIVDPDSGDVLSLSTRFCRDADRWKDGMPNSLATSYTTLQTLDLHNSRYLTALD